MITLYMIWYLVLSIRAGQILYTSLVHESYDTTEIHNGEQSKKSGWCDSFLKASQPIRGLPIENDL